VARIRTADDRQSAADNLEQGEVIFIDPSLADGFWTDAERVKAYFLGLGVGNIRHYRMTTQEFVTTSDYRALGKIGLVFIDSLHTSSRRSSTTRPSPLCSSRAGSSCFTTA
jgi:hypothetical protein